jgi:hypothetical protein
VAAHSIIAVRGDGPVVDGNDGVVQYSSAHLDEAASELVARSGHSTQANPRTIAEVRRILLLHLRKACGADAECANIVPASQSEHVQRMVQHLSFQGPRLMVNFTFWQPSTTSVGLAPLGHTC